MEESVITSLKIIVASCRLVLMNRHYIVNKMPTIDMYFVQDALLFIVATSERETKLVTDATGRRPVRSRATLPESRARKYRMLR
jgi:hypothetical protein